jgi:glycosyltransferase involved in cell wall biosynthesis
MNTVPKVSVIIPTFNRAQILGRAIASVLGQTFVDLELIVVDDGSSDETAALIQNFADVRLRYLQQLQNLGVSAARNRGIAEARGEWLAFLDSDDLWLPQKLERQFAALQGVDCVATYCGLLRFDGQTETRIPYRADTVNSGAQPWPSLLMDGLWYSQTWLLPRRVMIAAGLFDERMSIWEDWDLFLRIALQGPIHHLPEVLVHSMVSHDSLVGQHQNRPHSLRILQQKHAALFAQDPLVVAHHVYTRARFELLYGSWLAGWRALVHAIALQPLKARGWILLAASFTGRKSLQHIVEWIKQRKG